MATFDNGWFQIAPLRAQAAKVMELFAVPPANPVGDAQHRDGDAGEVTFQNVAVRGDGERNILEGVNLDIPRGTTIAVVGRSGVGKTTLGALVGAPRWSSHIAPVPRQRRTSSLPTGCRRRCAPSGCW